MAKGKTTDGVVSKYINRKISSRITSWIVKHRIGVTPNQISVISSIIGMLSFPFFLLGQTIVAGILVQTSSIIDGVDGELARYYGISSKFGAFFDALLDRFTDVVVVLGASIYVLMQGGLSWFVYVVLLTSLSGTLLVSYLHARSEKELGTHPVFIGRMPNIASRDIRLLIIFIGSLIGMVFEALLLIAILSNTYVIIKFLELSSSFSSKQKI